MNDKWMTKAKKDNPAESLIAKMKLTQARIAKNDQGASRTATLRRPYQLLILLLCRLYGRKSGRFFKSSWAPLIHEISTNGTILNWATILSDSMSLAINQIRKSAQVTGFYMSSYFMDAVCASNTFPALSWRWTPKCHPDLLPYAMGAQVQGFLYRDHLPLHYPTAQGSSRITCPIHVRECSEVHRHSGGLVCEHSRSVFHNLWCYHGTSYIPLLHS